MFPGQVPYGLSTGSRFAPEQDEDQGGAVSWLLRGLGAAGSLLDLPGSMVRDTLALKNPFDQVMTPFSEENRTTGRDLLRQYGMVGEEDNWGNLAGGIGAEILLDPLGGPLNKLLKGAGKAAAGGALSAGDKLTSALARPPRVPPEGLSRAARARRGAINPNRLSAEERAARQGAGDLPNDVYKEFDKAIARSSTLPPKQRAEAFKKIRQQYFPESQVEEVAKVVPPEVPPEAIAPSRATPQVAGRGRRPLKEQDNHFIETLQSSGGDPNTFDVYSDYLREIGDDDMSDIMRFVGDRQRPALGPPGSQNKEFRSRNLNKRWIHQTEAAAPFRQGGREGEQIGHLMRNLELFNDDEFSGLADYIRSADTSKSHTPQGLFLSRISVDPRVYHLDPPANNVMRDVMGRELYQFHDRIDDLEIRLDFAMDDLAAEPPSHILSEHLEQEAQRQAERGWRQGLQSRIDRIQGDLVDSTKQRDHIFKLQARSLLKQERLGDLNSAEVQRLEEYRGTLADWQRSFQQGVQQGMPERASKLFQPDEANSLLAAWKLESGMTEWERM